MTQYLLSVYMVEGAPVPTAEEMEKAYKDVDAFNAEIQKSGHWVFAGGLQPADTSTVVRGDGKGDVITTDGPFAETKEQLGGFWVIQAEDLDAALEIARRGAVACEGDVEVRPFQGEE